MNRSLLLPLMALALLLALPACDAGDDDDNADDDDDIADDDDDNADDDDDNADDDDTSNQGTPDDPPPLNEVGPTPFYDGVSFLFDGDGAVQLDADIDAFDRDRIAVVRGQVEDRSGDPLADVTISIQGLPEHGYTFSRPDGWFDLAVNGGGVLLVDFEKDGYLLSQRSLQVGWQDYSISEPVVMVPLAAKSSLVELDGSQGLQAIQGDVESDLDGDRQPVILFPSGTEATMTLPDGDTAPLTSLSVRITEYTVGDSGPAAMPADLPASSGYTYAIDLSVDEAAAQDATQVDFTQPLAFYMENFLDIPTGLGVPAGYYDRESGFWVAAPDGVVLEIIAIDDGLAELDLDGDGVAEDPAALEDSGVSDEEREDLATRYSVGQSLWRMPIEHFSAWDFNWSHGPPPSCDPAVQSCAPDQSDPEPESPQTPAKMDCNREGSVIRCVSQSLGESPPIAGTDFSLHYTSSRATGNDSSRTLTIPVSGDSVPTDLEEISVTVTVAGTETEQFFSPAPNQTYDFVWDGLDAYDRSVECGSVPVQVDLTYWYEPVYYASPPSFAGSFGRTRGGTSVVDGWATLVARSADDIGFNQRWVGNLGGCSLEGEGLGGWSLGPQHLYDPLGKTLYRGDGTIRDTASLPAVLDGLSSTASTATAPSLSQPGALNEARFTGAQDIAARPDGAFYLMSAELVWLVEPDGTIVHFAGGGSPTDGVGDGGLATDANLGNNLLNQLYYDHHMAVGPGGDVYVTGVYSEAEGLFRRVRRIDSEGTIATVARWPTSEVGVIYDLQAGPAGELYLATQAPSQIGSDTVWQVDTDGESYIVAGGGTTRPDAAETATEASLLDLQIAVQDTGDLYVATSSQTSFHYQVFQLSPSDAWRLVAGATSGSFDDEGFPATDSPLGLPRALEVASDGTIYVSEATSFVSSVARIRAISPSGILRTVAGGETAGGSWFDLPVTAPALSDRFYSAPRSLSMGPDGRLYILEGGAGEVLRLGSALPDAVGIAEIPIPSETGSVVYVFDSSGRQLRTLDATTAATLLTFAHDAEGRLLTLTDAEGQVTTVERDSEGMGTAIVGPYGHRSELVVSASGDLTSFSDPLGNEWSLTYEGDTGLLQSLTNPRGDLYAFEFDDKDRLTGDTDPVEAAAGSPGKQLVRDSDDPNDYTVSFTSAEGVTTDYGLQTLTGEGQVRTVSHPDGTQSITGRGGDGLTTHTGRDGTVIELQEGPDPRFGMLAPIPQSASITTPLGRVYEQSMTRALSLADPSDPWHLGVLTDELVVNGRTWTTSYDGNTREEVTTTPEGREVTTQLDSQGRVEQLTVAGLNPMDLAYDSDGRLESVTWGSRSADLSYDSEGNLESITDALGDTASFQYDAAARPTEAEDPDGNTVTVTRDELGEVTTLTPPGRPAHSFAYSPVGRMTAYTPPAASDTGLLSTTADHNLDRQTTTVTRPDGELLQASYDSAGRQVQVTTDRGAFSTTYMDAWVDTVVTPEGQTLDYDHDGPLLTQVTWSGLVSGSVSFDYDADFRLSEVTLGSQAVAYGYDQDGLLTGAGALALTRDPDHGGISATALGSVTTTHGINGHGELQSFEATYPGGSYSYGLVRDDAGRITEKTETIQGDTATTAYSYDDAGRLETVSVGAVITEEYAYDANGNRTSATVDGVTSLGTYDDQDRLVTYGGDDYSYGAAGHLESTSSGLFTDYDAFGNLMSVTTPSGTTVDYLVDAEGRRVERDDAASVTRYLWQDGLRIEAQLDGSDAVVSRFVYGESPNVPEYMVRGGSTYRLLTDHLGSVRLVVDVDTGAVAQRMDYDAFGVVQTDTNPGFQPFGFAGGLYDPDSGLVRFGARDYDPVTGRWTDKDPIGFEGGSANLYEYVYGNPLNYVDLDGETPEPAWSIGNYGGTKPEGGLPGDGSKRHVHWGTKRNPRGGGAVNMDGTLRHGKKPPSKVQRMLKKLFKIRIQPAFNFILDPCLLFPKACMSDEEWSRRPENCFT